MGIFFITLLLVGDIGMSFFAMLSLVPLTLLGVSLLGYLLGSSEEAQGLIRKSISSRDIKRDFFLPSGTKSSVNLQGNEQDITEETKNLKLVGIIWSKNPEVMIENAKDSRTYVLKKGDFLDERFKVTEISRTSAILVVTTEEGPKQFEIR